MEISSNNKLSATWRWVLLVGLCLIGCSVVTGVQQQTDPLDCSPEHCAHISCPADSRSIYEQLSAVSAIADDDHTPFALYIGQHDTYPTIIHTAPNQNTTNTSPSDDTTLPNALLRSKRSVRHLQRREPIKIVPGEPHIGHLHKREATPVQLEHCCRRKFCVCDTKCEHPVCGAGEVKVQTDKSSLRPGHCCPQYECRRPACYSQFHGKEFEHGARWSQDACTTCECINGSELCQSSLCKPLACERTITVAGECCPQCDRQNSPFCAGDEDCNRACKYGYQQSADHNCKLCKCVRNHKKLNHTTTTTTTTTTDATILSSSTDVPTVFEVEVPSTSAPSTSSSTTTTTTTTTTPEPSLPDTPWDHFDMYNEFSPPTVDNDNNGETDPTIMSIRSYFQEHHLYIIVAASVFTVAMLFGALVWTYCKFSHKNSYNIVPNA